MKALTLAAAAAFLTIPTGGAAQSIGQRIADAGDGKVRMSFEARDGVCDDGRRMHIGIRDEDWEWRCDPGPVRVSLTVRDRRVARVSTYVGGAWRASARVVLDLGDVDASDAADYLLSIAADEDLVDGEEAVQAAALAAEAVIWPQLLGMARDRNLASDVRSQAIFWLGQEAAREATAGLVEILDDDDEEIRIRQQAVFAISQHDEEGVPILIRVARTNRHPQLRRIAFFWLADSEDSRAIALFEEILGY